MSRTRLYVFGGLPGTGKSTLAAMLAQRRRAAYLRIDTVEQAVRDAGLTADGPAGYLVGYGLAAENLRLGLSVVADSVNPLRLTRRAWRQVAAQSQVLCIEIEIVCSDPAEHRARVESRPSTVPGLRLPSWPEVVGREYEPWDTERLLLDTAGSTPSESLRHLLALLDAWEAAPE